MPHVNTADEARAAVDAVKYAPDGHRGIFSGGRPAGYGFKGSTADYAKDANRQTLVCLMLEEVEAIENLPELVKVPGVDVFFIGAGVRWMWDEWSSRIMSLIRSYSSGFVWHSSARPRYFSRIAVQSTPW